MTQLYIQWNVIIVCVSDANHYSIQNSLVPANGDITNQFEITFVIITTYIHLISCMFSKPQFHDSEMLLCRKARLFPQSSNIEQVLSDR